MNNCFVISAVWRNRLASITMCWAVCFSAAHANLEPHDNHITGAGAHFAWIVFDEMKQDLERVAGRPLELYGQGSLLGVGCNAGIKNALRSTPEHETFGFTCCPLSKQEINKKQLLLSPIAKEPILVVVNDSNPINSLSAKQIRAVFKGEIANWKELGGPDKPIVVVARMHCNNRPGHWKTILPNKKSFREQRLNVTSAAEMLENINLLKYAIGFMGSAWRFEPSDHVKALRVDNVKPTAQNLKNGRYPFYRQLSAVTNRHPSKAVRAIIDYAQTSQKLHDIARKYNLLPLNPMK